MDRKRQTVMMMGYIVLIFVFSTGCLITQVFYEVGDEEILLGLSTSDESVQLKVTASTVFDVLLALLVFLADALLIWRCATMYKSQSSSVSRIILVSPCCTILAVTGLGINYLIFIVRSGHAQLNAAEIHFSNMTLVAFWVLSLLNNAIITAMMVHHVRSRQRFISSTVGARHGSVYTRITTMLLESAALIVIMDVLALIFLCLESFTVENNSLYVPLYNLLLTESPHTYVLAVLLVVYRVSVGVSEWSSEVDPKLTEIRFTT